MRQEEHTPILDDVLDAYAAAGPSRSALPEWIKRYPHFREDLVDFTVQWAVIRHLPSTKSSTDPELLTLRGMSIVEDLLHSTGSQELAGDQERGFEGAEPLPDKATGRNPPSILEQILTRCELDLETFGQCAGLGFALLVNLEMGRLTFKNEREKERVVVALADSIFTAAPAPPPTPAHLLPLLRTALDQPARRSAGANLSRSKPRVVTQDFFEAVRTDPDMSPEEKERWSGLESDE